MILSRVKKNKKGCLEWQGALRNGYGAIKYQGKVVGAHRLSFCIANKEDMNGDFLVCHKCDNRKCINPKHLFKGTYSMNRIDALKKGRAKMPTGGQFKKGHIPSSRPSFKSFGFIKFIRDKNRNKTLKEISIFYKIPLHTVKDISSGRVYNNIK